MYRKTYNPCDDCQYGFEKRNGSGHDATCRICEFNEFIRAEQDGLMLMLPFKIGTTLYRVTIPYRQEPKITEFIVTNFVMRGKRHELMVEVRVNGVPGTNVMKIKSFYRTREEAEAALAKKGGEINA